MSNNCPRTYISVGRPRKHTSNWPSWYLSRGRTATAGAGRRGTRRRATATTATAHARALILNTALFGVVRSGVNTSVLSAINANGDPSEDAIGEVVAEQNVLHERIDGLSLLGQNAIIGVGGEGLGVGGVGRKLIDLGDQVLVEEELANVGGLGGVQAADSVVLEDGGLVGRVGQDCTNKC